MATGSGVLAALRHRDYRYYWLGQSISLVGTSMQSAALVWLAYTITGSAKSVALIATFQMVPLIAAALPAGVIIDRLPKRRLIMATQAVFMFHALALAVLSAANLVTYPVLLALASAYGLAQAFDKPCRSAFLVDMVGKSDLMNAISLNSTVSSVARIIGPPLAGVALASLGANWCFLINAVTYAMVILALSLVSVDGTPGAPARRGQILGDMREGLKYVWQTTSLRLTMLMLLVMGVFGLNYNVIVPVYIDKVLRLDVKAYGTALSAIGIGALLAALYGTVGSRKASSGMVFAVAGLSVGLAQVLISGARSLWLVLLLLTLLGFSMTLFVNNVYQTMQAGSRTELRGRVMGVTSLIDQGTMPLGNAFAGIAADSLGAATSSAICGGLTAILIGSLLLRKMSLRVTR